MVKKIKIAFVGMSHLGLNYLAATSEKGFNVLGIDINKKRIEKLNNHNIEYEEPHLKKIIVKNKKKITFSSNFNFLKKSHVIFISQDIDTDSKGKSNLFLLKKLIKKTIKSINKKAILIIMSQVLPGFTRQIKFDHSRLFYSVETLIFGQAFKRALDPERIIVGCRNSKTKIKYNYLKFLQSFKCPIIKMKYESAEITKVSINILLASSITTSNLLAQACENVSADWNEVMPALKLDKRIGKKSYIKPGLGISGGNIERDIYSVKKIVKHTKEHASVLSTFQKNSNYMKLWVYRILKKTKILKKKRTLNIGILGMAYKENTNSIKNSPALSVLNFLKGNNIMIYDPKAKLPKKYKNCIQSNNPNDLINRSKVIILMTPWSEFVKFNKLFRLINKKTILIDPYRILNFELINNRYIKYYTIGR